MKRLAAGLAAVFVAACVTAATAAATHGPITRVSIRLAALGGNVRSPRGPFAVRPHKIAFDLGGYYGAGTKGLWIENLHWVDWGHPVAYASGTVYARIWPTKKFLPLASV